MTYLLEASELCAWIPQPMRETSLPADTQGQGTLCCPSVGGDTDPETQVQRWEPHLATTNTVQRRKPVWMSERLVTTVTDWRIGVGYLQRVKGPKSCGCSFSGVDMCSKCTALNNVFSSLLLHLLFERHCAERRPCRDCFHFIRWSGKFPLAHLKSLQSTQVWRGNLRHPVRVWATQWSILSFEWGGTTRKTRIRQQMLLLLSFDYIQRITSLNKHHIDIIFNDFSYFNGDNQVNV